MVTGAEKFSSTAATESIRFAGKARGVEAHVRSGGTAKRSSACGILSWPIGVSASGRGAGRSLRNFSVEKQEEISIPERITPGGVSF
jgi:hypothetical protein